MDSTTIIWIVGAIVGIGAGGYFAYNHFKKKNLDKLFQPALCDGKTSA